MSPAQTQYQEQLQRKHEELQQMILQQQQELRLVSDQLLMARYGLLPASLLNVSVLLSNCRKATKYCFFASNNPIYFSLRCPFHILYPVVL